MHAFDRQMDGRTDRIPIAIPRLHSMQRGKNDGLSYLRQKRMHKMMETEPGVVWLTWFNIPLKIF